ncbi:hypothetical protein H4I96_01402 [Botrytis cinerea]
MHANDWRNSFWMNNWQAVECYTVSNNMKPQHPNGFGDDIFPGRAALRSFRYFERSFERHISTENYTFKWYNEEKLMAGHEVSDHETTQDRGLLLKSEMRELNKIGALKTVTGKVGTDGN